MLNLDSETLILSEDHIFSMFRSCPNNFGIFTMVPVEVLVHPRQPYWSALGANSQPFCAGQQQKPYLFMGRFKGSKATLHRHIKCVPRTSLLQDMVLAAALPCTIPKWVGSLLPRLACTVWGRNTQCPAPRLLVVKNKKVFAGCRMQSPATI
jgi:hypothetical protein